MAIAAVPEEETRLCGNCKKDIPAANFIIHEIHCSRNLDVCRYCGDSIPRSGMKNHIESEHAQVTCKCRMKMENCLLKDHEALACPLRPALCQYCDIQLPSNKLQHHEVYCGARTETCGGCSHNIMVKDLKEHPRVCGQGVKQARGSTTVPRFEDEDGDLHTLRGTGTRRRAEEELERSERDENARSGLHDEWSADLDYALALSLQQEDNPQGNTGVPQDFWETCCTKEPVPSACLNEMDTPNTFSWDSSGSFSASNHVKSDELTMLPCEFCEEMFPAEDLILHQTGCNPASAFASFSKRSSSPNPRGCDGLRAFGSSSCRSLSSSQPQAVQAEGNIMIPCEFCGIQLEEETLCHHQHQCDLRPASPAASCPAPQPLSPQANRERRDAPELARRPSRHRGDVSPCCAEGFGQQKLSCPRTKSLSDKASVRNTLLSSPARASGAPHSIGEPRKAAGSEGTPKEQGGAAGGTRPHARAAQNFHSEAFASSSSRASPAQPSTSSRGGRRLGMADAPVGFRHSGTQVTAQSAAPGQPEGKRAATLDATASTCCSVTEPHRPHSSQHQQGL